MVQSVLYFISFLLFFLLCFFYPKHKERMNAITCAMISYVTTLSYGAGAALIIQVLGFRVDNGHVAAGYAMGCIVLLLLLGKEKRVQPIGIYKRDVISLGLLCVIIVYVCVHVFSSHFYMNYHNGVDSANHFKYAMDIVRNGKLSGMYFAQFQNAMFMEMLLPFVPDTWNYKLFVLADCFHTLMECFFFYGMIVHFMTQKEKKALPFIITLLYWCGFPLYSFVTGSYIYWAMGAMCVQYVLLLLRIYEECNFRSRRIIVFIALGLLAVTTCYIEFAPGIFLSVFGILTYQLYKEGKIAFNQSFFIKIGIIGILACICAIIGYYFIFAKRGLKVFDVFMMGVDTNKQLEIVLSIPFVYYIIYQQIKRKQLDTLAIGTICYVFVQIGFTVFAMAGKMSAYYLLKSSYIFWTICWIYIVYRPISIPEKTKTDFKHYVVLCIGVLMFSYCPSVDADYQSITLNNSIWKHNMQEFANYDFREQFIDANILDFFAYIYEKYPDDDVVFISDNTQKGTCAFYSANINKSYYYDMPMTVETIENYLKTYDGTRMLVLTNTNAYRENQEYFDSLEREYSTEDGFIAIIK